MSLYAGRIVTAYYSTGALTNPDNQPADLKGQPYKYGAANAFDLMDEIGKKKDGVIDTDEAAQFEKELETDPNVDATFKAKFLSAVQTMNTEANKTADPAHFTVDKAKFESYFA
jgi:hypothetical protein